MDADTLIDTALSTAWTSLLGGLTQDSRLLRLHTALGTDALFAEDVHVWEGIGPQQGPSLSDDIPGLDLGPTRAGLRLVVHALSTDAHLELKRLIGQPALLELLCQDSRSELRPWHGHVVAAALVGSDGGLARYRLVIEPWLALLDRRVDSYVFQDMTVPQIIDEVLGDYGDQTPLAPAWRWDLADSSVYPRRSLCLQYQESDLDFVLRLMREEGLVAWWEHTGDADGTTLGSHTLVLADHNAAMATNRQSEVRFTASDHTLGEDSLTHWRDLQRVSSARVALQSWDHRSLSSRPVQADTGSTGAGAPLPELAVADVPGAYAYEDLDQGQRLARVQAEALGALQQRALAHGPWRRAEAGTTFTLVDHPLHDGSDDLRDRFAILACQHRARNNFSADARARLRALDRQLALEATAEAAEQHGTQDDADRERPLHEAALLLQPAATPVRMAQAPAGDGPGRWGTLGATAQRTGPTVDLFDPRSARHLAQPDVRLAPRPSVHGSQTALVVGSGMGNNGPIHTDRDARIKVQFHWQRGGNASHRLMHPTGENAPASEASFTWVRVGQSIAGANHGAVFIPRLGQEVVVGFVGGDIDRPVVHAVAYNGQGSDDAQGNQQGAGAAGAVGAAPAWFPGQADAAPHQGHQHPAVLLGYKSQELASSSNGQGGFGQLVFDDSPQAARIELGSSTLVSQLQLGALLQQQDNQRLAPRGHGLDLLTQGHGALRSGRGLLLTAFAESPSTGSGQQLQARDPLQALQTAQDLVHTLAETSQAHQAQLPGEPAVAGAKPDDRSRQLPSEQGMTALTASLQASDSRQGGESTGDESTIAIDGGWGSVSAWDRPDITLAAPAGLGLFTPAQAILCTQASLTLSAGQDLLSLAQGHHASVAKAGAVLFTYGQASSASKPNTEVGIAIHAATGSLQASANTATAELTASQAIDVASTQANVLVGAPTSVLLTAAGAAIDIQSGSITLKAPGSVQFKAASKVWTAAGSLSESLQLPELPRLTGQFTKQFALYSLEGTALQGALMEVYRRGERSLLWKGQVSSEGLAELDTHEAVADYFVLAGYDAWTSEFADLEPESLQDDEPAFSLGESDEEGRDEEKQASNAP